MTLKPFQHHESIKEVIAHFTPNWFAVNMGTGITAICLNTLSNKFPGITDIATALWIFNIVIFCLFSLAFITRLVYFPSSMNRMLNHSAQPMFLGCIPMGLATIINGFIIFAYPLIGQDAINIALWLWWFDVILSIVCVILVPYCMFHYQEHSLQTMTGVWLLPFVACEVAAASAGLLLPHLSAANALPIFILSLILWAVSVSLALSILVILFNRLVMHKLPSRELAATIWLPLGPTGTGALAMFLLGSGAKTFSLQGGLPGQFVELLHMFPGISMFVGIILWTLATWWMLIALIATAIYCKSGPLKFNLGFWGYTFPLGVYTMASVNLAKFTGYALFAFYSNILVIVLCMIWVGVFLKTMRGAYHGSLIHDATLVNN